MQAKKLAHEKYVTEQGDIIEVVIWEVPKSHHFPHGVKYRMAYIHENKRTFGYDNERGKGHHKHLFGQEKQIEFESWEKLVKQFRNQVEKIRRDLYESESEGYRDNN